MQRVRGSNAEMHLALHRSMTQFEGKKTLRQGDPIMSAILTELQTRLRQRAAYRRTKAELENMPLVVAIDLDIYQPDAARLASQAVYGR